MIKLSSAIKQKWKRRLWYINWCGVSMERNHDNLSNIQFNITYIVFTPADGNIHQRNNNSLFRRVAICDSGCSECHRNYYCFTSTFIEVLPVSTIIDCICINFVHDPCWVNKQRVRGRRKIPKTSNLARVENTHLIGWRKRDCIDIYMKIMADLRWPGSIGPLFKGLTFHLKHLTPKMVTCQI